MTQLTPTAFDLLLQWAERRGYQPHLHDPSFASLQVDGLSLGVSRQPDPRYYRMEARIELGSAFGDLPANLAFMCLQVLSWVSSETMLAKAFITPPPAAEPYLAVEGLVYSTAHADEQFDFNLVCLNEAFEMLESNLLSNMRAAFPG